MEKTCDEYEILISEKQISDAVTKLGGKIRRDYAGKKPVFIGVLKGAVMFQADLCRAVGDLPAEMAFVVARSYGNAAVSSGELTIRLDVSDGEVRGRDVLVVEDIVDTGLTLARLTEHLFEKGAASVKVAVFMDKKSARKIPFEPDYACFEAPDAFLVGYGLDYAERYRTLPFVAALDPKVYNLNK